MKEYIINEKNFEDDYKNKVGAFCREYETNGCYDSADGKKMHYISYINENAKADIVILHGFTECAKKFEEMAYYFFCEGFNVYAPDLRGHGLSFKDNAPEYAVGSKGFGYYSADVSLFIKNTVKKEGRPVYCFTHSLGGCAVLLALMDCPELPVEKIVLSSPMICGNMGMPVALARLVAKLVCAVGKGSMPAPKKCVFEPEKANPDAADENRGKHYLKLKQENKAYQTCGPTMEWVLHSIEARDKLLKKENIEKLNVEMLVIKPESDRQLLEKYQDMFIASCRDSGKRIQTVKLKNTCHEIFQSKNRELAEYIEKILEFFDA